MPRPRTTLRKLALLLGRVSRFVGISQHLLIAGLMSKHNLRAAWIQSDRGWDHCLQINYLSDEEIDAWLGTEHPRDGGALR